MILPEPTRAFHAMAKPGGARCNLNCAYCFYIERARSAQSRMSHDVLEAYVRNYITSLKVEEEVPFTWQGGEPTLLGMDFYSRALKLQQRYGQGRYITNSLQTNGLLLNDAWCAFLKKHDFLVGLSLDGPAAIHDEYRRTPNGRGSQQLVMRALKRLQAHGVRYNVLACVNERSAQEPLRVYEFLGEAGVEFIQFLPVVERLAGPEENAKGLRLAGPGRGEQAGPPSLASWSVSAEGYGRFLTSIFDRWVRRDVGKVFVMNFEWALASYLGRPGAVCHHQPTCGRSVVVEYNGDVYACDHYVYPRFKLGNITGQTLAAMVDGQEQFGTDKYAALPAKCLKCAVLKGCWGGCPKLRFMAEPDGDVNYLCAGYYHYFSHIAPYLKAFANLFDSGRPASEIMNATLVHL